MKRKIQKDLKEKKGYPVFMEYYPIKKQKKRKVAEQHFIVPWEVAEKDK